ncbi:MAG: hypothetical protein MO846_06145 [Candidatus Devosia symbiotica]|nr:hypothetical protein [Candidatus Devosia symbiotica]
MLRSISRTMPECVPVEVRPVSAKARELMSIYSDMEELIRLGGLTRKGQLSKVDRAIAIYPALEALLSQDREETTTIAQGYKMLEAVVAEAGAAD